MNLCTMLESVAIYLIFCYVTNFGVSSTTQTEDKSQNPGTQHTARTLTAEVPVQSQPEPSGGNVSQFSHVDHKSQDSSSSESNNLIELDLDKKETTDQVEYSKDVTTNVDTYNAKNSLLFKKVTRATDIIWEAQNDIYPNKLTVTQHSDGMSSMKLFYPGDGSDAGSSTPELVELDIGVDKSTDYYEYSDETYTAKTGYSFIKVYNKQHPLTVFQDKYPNKIEVDKTDSGDIILTLGYEDNTTSISVLNDLDKSPPSLSADPHSSVTSTASVLPGSEVYVDHLKLLTMNEQGLPTEDTSKFDVQTLTDLLNYTFKEGSRCTEIKYDNQIVWKYDHKVHRNKYPTNVLLNTNTKFIMLESTDAYQYFYSYYNNQWHQISSYRSDSIKLNLSKLKFMTDENGTTKEIDQSVFTKSEEGSIVSYVFKDGSKCVDVIYDGVSVWKYVESEHAHKYPTKTIINMDTLSLTVDSLDDYRHFYSYHDKKFTQVFAYKSDSTKLNPNRLKVITDYLGTLKENDDYEFDKTKKGSVVNYKFRATSKCVEVKYDQTTVWKHDNSVHGDKYPTSLLFNVVRNVLVIKSSNQYSDLYSYYNDKWNLGPSFRSKSTESKFDKLKIETLESDGKRNENDETKFDKKEQGSVAIYTFKPGARCTAIKYDNDLVWEHDVKKYGYTYPTGLTLNVSTSFLLLESKNQYQYFYSYYEGSWNSIFSYKSHELKGSLDNSKLKLLAVNTHGTLLIDDSTKFELEESARVYTYKFKDGVFCFRVSYEDDLVWEYNPDKHRDYYPTTLVFNVDKELIMVESKDQYLHFYSFYRSEWRPVMGAVSHVPTYVPVKYTEYEMPLKLEQSKVKLLLKTIDDTNVENDTSRYYFKEIKNFVTYNFYYNGYCINVLYDDVSVWKASDHPGSRLPKQLVLNKDGNTLYVDCSDRFFMYQLLDSKWNLVSTFDPNLPRTPGSQDQSDKTKLEVFTSEYDGSTGSLDNTAYDSSEDDETNLLTYKFKDDVKCTEVKYRDSTAWKHDDTVSGGKYPNAVYLHTDVERVVVEFDGFYLRYEFKDNKCNFVLLADTSHFDQSQFKLYTLYDNNDYYKCYANDTRKYDVVKSYNEIQYRLKSDAKCLRVRYRGKLVWKHDKGDFHVYHPTKVTFNLDTRRVFLHFRKNWYYVTQLIYVDWKVVKSVEDGKPTDIPQDPNYKPEQLEEFQHPPDPQQLQGLPKTQSTDGGTPVTPSQDATKPSHASSTPPDSSSTPKSEPDGSTPTSDGSVQQTPSAVPESDSSVSEATTPSGDGSLAKPELDGSSVSEDQSSQPSGTPEDNPSSEPAKQEGSEAPKSGGGSSSTPLVEVDDVPKAPTRIGDKRQKSHDPSVEKKIKIFTKHSSSPETKENEQNHYDRKEGEMVCYEFKADIKCLEVKFEDRDVWKHSDDCGNLVPKVCLHTPDSLIIVEFKDISFLYRYSDSKIELVYTRRPTPVPVDVKVKQSGIEYEFSEVDSGRKYIAKKFYSFNPVKIGDVVIFDTNNLFHYSTEVLMSSDSITLTLLNGKEKKFVKNGKKFEEVPVSGSERSKSPSS